MTTNIYLKYLLPAKLTKFKPSTFQRPGLGQSVGGFRLGDQKALGGWRGSSDVGCWRLLRHFRDLRGYDNKTPHKKIASATIIWPFVPAAQDQLGLTLTKRTPGMLSCQPQLRMTGCFKKGHVGLKYGCNMVSGQRELREQEFFFKFNDLFGVQLFCSSFF